VSFAIARFCTSAPCSPLSSPISQVAPFVQSTWILDCAVNGVDAVLVKDWKSRIVADTVQLTSTFAVTWKVAVTEAASDRPNGNAEASATSMPAPARCVRMAVLLLGRMRAWVRATEALNWTLVQSLTDETTSADAMTLLLEKASLQRQEREGLCAAVDGDAGAITTGSKIGAAPHDCLAQFRLDDTRFVRVREIGPVRCLPCLVPGGRGL